MICVAANHQTKGKDQGETYEKVERGENYKSPSTGAGGGLPLGLKLPKNPQKEDTRENLERGGGGTGGGNEKGENGKGPAVE